MPGGCDFGVRPIDQHLKGFAALGAEVSLDQGMVDAHADELVGNQIYLDVLSVGATINIMLAATKAKGLTILLPCYYKALKNIEEVKYNQKGRRRQHVEK